jgi:hypothetical protein
MFKNRIDKLHREIEILWNAIERAGGKVVDVSNELDTATLYVSGLDESVLEDLVHRTSAVADYYVGYDPEYGMVEIAIFV